MQKFAEEMYKNVAPEQGASEASEAKGSSAEDAQSSKSTKTESDNAEVIDAEFDMVEDDKGKWASSHARRGAVLLMKKYKTKFTTNTKHQQKREE